MKMFITYLLSALFLLFFAETKVFAGTQHFQGNLTSRIFITQVKLLKLNFLKLQIQINFKNLTQVSKRLMMIFRHQTKSI